MIVSAVTCLMTRVLVFWVGGFYSVFKKKNVYNCVKGEARCIFVLLFEIVCVNIYVLTQVHVRTLGKLT